MAINTLGTPLGRHCPEGALAAPSWTHTAAGPGLTASNQQRYREGAEGWAQGGRSVRGPGRGQMSQGHAPTPPGPAPGLATSRFPSPCQDSAPGCGLFCGCSSHAEAQFSGSSPRPQDSPLSGPVQRPEIGRKRGLKIALITEGPKGVGGGGSSLAPGHCHSRPRILLRPWGRDPTLGLLSQPTAGLPVGQGVRGGAGGWASRGV